MTGSIMTEGEQLERGRRRRYWRTLGLVGLAGIPVGLLVGYSAGKEGGNLSTFFHVAPDWLVIAVIAGSVVVFTWFTVRFLRSIDEVELADNLWCSTAAYYLYAVLFPAWWALAEAGIVGAVNNWLIYFAALAGGLAFYGWRKWRAR